MTIRLTCPRCKARVETPYAKVVYCRTCGGAIKPKVAQYTPPLSSLEKAIANFERWVRETVGLPAK